MKIRSLIIDDEPLARRVIERYAGEIPHLEIAGKCSSAMEALEVLHDEEIDLLFLDINMPGLSGLDFLRTFKNPPLVIIVTAYAEYALQGFELDVVDYLMKPYSFDRFHRAVMKAEELLRGRGAQRAAKKEPESQEENFIFVKSGKKTFRVNLAEILYIEALGDYVKIHTTGKMIISYQSLKNIEALLPASAYPRVHKSFIIALSRIDLIEGNHVRIGDRLIPVGSNFKAEFEKLIKAL